MKRCVEWFNPFSTTTTPEERMSLANGPSRSAATRYVEDPSLPVTASSSVSRCRRTLNALTPLLYLLPVLAAFGDSFFNMEVVVGGINLMIPLFWMMAIALFTSVNQMALETAGMREHLSEGGCTKKSALAMIVPAASECWLFGKSFYDQFAQSPLLGGSLALIFGGSAAAQCFVVEARALEDVWEKPPFLLDRQFLAKKGWWRYLFAAGVNIASLLLSTTYVGPIAIDVFDRLGFLSDYLAPRFHFSVRLFSALFIAGFYLNAQLALTGEEFKKMVYSEFRRFVAAINHHRSQRGKILIILATSGIMAMVHSAGAYFLILNTTQRILNIKTTPLALRGFCYAAAGITWVSTLITNGMRLLLLSSNTRFFPDKHFYQELEKAFNPPEESSSLKTTANTPLLRIRNFYVAMPLWLLQIFSKLSYESFTKPKVQLSEIAFSNMIATLPLALAKLIIDRRDGVPIRKIWKDILFLAANVCSSTGVQLLLAHLFSTERHHASADQTLTRSEMFTQLFIWLSYCGYIVHAHFAKHPHTGVRHNFCDTLWGRLRGMSQDTSLLHIADDAAHTANP